MRRALVVAAVAACGTPARPKPPDVTRGSAPPPAVAPVPAPSDQVVVRGGGRTKRIEAPHGGSITQLATSTDGNTVVSVDELGGARLWTALDGSAEPRVVDLPRPADLAVGPHARGYVIATVDAVGALAIQLVDADGITHQRMTLPLEPAYGGVASATAKGVLAWRTDQRVMLLSPDTGAVTAELPTEAGQRIVALAANADRAVAIIEAGSPPTRRARWLSLSPLAWGAFIGGADDLGTNVAVSPSGKRVASLTASLPRGIAVAVLDTAKQQLVAYEPAPGALAVALPTDDHVAVAVQNGVQWVDLSRTTPKRPLTNAQPPPPPPDTTPLVGTGAGGRAIGAVHGELVIGTPAKHEFLGYALGSPAVASAAPNGALLIGLGDTFALLDSALADHPPPALQIPSGSSVADLRWLGGAEWLVQSSRLADGITSIRLVDTAAQQHHDVRKDMTMVHMMAHEPATQLVAFSLGDTPELLRHVPGKLKLERVAKLPRPTGFERAELVPVDPALAGGTQVVVIHMRERLTVRWAKDPHRLDATPPLVVDGSLASVDRAGRVYVWQSDSSGTLVLAMYRDGKSFDVLPTDGPTSLWPDPGGTRVLQVSQRTITLLGVDGVRRWSQSLEGVTEAIWLDDDTIAIISAAGIARIDATTGAVRAARCGWRFGLSAKQHPISPRVEPVCTQLPDVAAGTP